MEQNGSLIKVYYNDMNIIHYDALDMNAFIISHYIIA